MVIDSCSIVIGDARVSDIAKSDQLQCCDQCLRKRYSVLDGYSIVVGDAKVSIIVKCDQLQCCDQCLREGYAVGDSPWIVAGDGGSVAVDTASGKLECSH